MPTFDGENKIITLDAPTGGVLNVDVADLYSYWKQWAQASNGVELKWLPAFRTIGGDPLGGGLNAGAYFFLQNQPGYGWRIVSSDADQTIYYTGNLVAEDPTSEIINPTPGRTVLHLGLQPVTQIVTVLETTGAVRARIRA